MVGECKNKRLSSVLFHVFSCLLGFIMIYPLLWLLASSFKSNDTMFHNTYSLIPETWDVVQNYLSGLAGVAGYSFMHFFKNSVIVTLVSVVTSIFSSLLAAYALARVKFRGSGFWFGCVIMTMMIPSQVMVVPQYIILRALHLNDTLAAMVLPAGGGGIVVGMVAVQQYSVPAHRPEGSAVALSLQFAVQDHLQQKAVVGTAGQLVAGQVGEEPDALQAEQAGPGQGPGGVVVIAGTGCDQRFTGKHEHPSPGDGLSQQSPVQQGALVGGVDGKHSLVAAGGGGGIAQTVAAQTDEVFAVSAVALGQVLVEELQIGQ